MVLSKLNKDIEYKESSAIDRDDINHSASTYNISFEQGELSGGSVVPTTILFGKQKNTHAHKGVVHFIVYLVVDKQVKCPIGVYETPETSLLSILDEDGELDPEKIDEPLLYKHVDRTFIERMQEPDSDSSSTSSEESEDNEDDDEEFDDVFSVKTGKFHSPDDENIHIDVNTVQQLPEETAQDAKIIKHEYSPSPNDTWIVKFMKNKKYKIESVDSDDSLFTSIKLALEQVGVRISVQKMRQKLASRAVDEDFQDYRRAYLIAQDTIKQNTETIDDFKRILKDLKNSRMKNARTTDERGVILTEANSVNERMTNLKKMNKDITDFTKHHFALMTSVTTFPEFQEYIRTSPRYKIDQWTISTIEQIVGIKIVVLQEKSFKDGALDCVLDCGKTILDAPTHYIMIAFDGLHHELVSYKGKKCLIYREIPYDIKAMILNKYLENNAGSFGKIQDFRNLISKMGFP
jgi:hypothetical protein